MRPFRVLSYDLHIIAKVYKKVKYLPTRQQSKNRDVTRFFDIFCTYKPDSVSIYEILTMIISLGCLLPNTSCDSDQAMLGIRSCTKVRILPFHPISYLIDLSQKDTCFFRFRRHCSHLSHYCGRVLPATLLLITQKRPGRVRTFLSKK